MNRLSERVLCMIVERGETNVIEIANALDAEVDDVIDVLDKALLKGLVAQCTYCFKNVDGEIGYVRSWSTDRIFKERRANW